MAIDGDDQVTENDLPEPVPRRGPQTGPFGRAVWGHVDDDIPSEIPPQGHLLRGGYDAEWADHFAVLDQLGYDAVDGRRRNGEADAGAKAPEGCKIAEFMPIRRPALSSSGPPELPGLMAASVWIRPLSGRPLDGIGLAPQAADDPLGQGVVEPNGLPMAYTSCPTCRSLVVPTSTGRSLSAGGVDVQHRDVLVGRDADRLGGPAGVVGQHDLHGRRRPR